MESLYRKYRPLTFDSVVGQQHIVSTLEHAIGEGRLSHAYLFCGPRGTGKTTMARILAKALLCEGSDAAREQGASGCMPDGTCEECELIAEGNHPDVYELDAASRTGVDNVREEIIGSVNFAPVRGKYKVYIIDEVHMLTTAAFNALLKTLEEPPAHVVFVLCTTDPQKILETILSRCQRFDFHRIGNEDIEGRLRYVCEQEGFEFDDEAIRIVARHARGGMRDALSTLEQLSVFGNGAVRTDDARSLLGEVSSTVLGEFVHGIAERDVVGLFGLVADQVDEGNDLLELTRDLVAHVRDVYMMRVAGRGSALFEGREDDAEALEAEAAAFESGDRIARALTVLDDAALGMRNAADARLVLEIAFTRLARPEAELTIEALAERVDALEARLANGAAPVQGAVPAAAGAPVQQASAAHSAAPAGSVQPARTGEPIGADKAAAFPTMARKKAAPAGTATGAPVQGTAPSPAASRPAMPPTGAAPSPAAAAPAAPPATRSAAAVAASAAPSTPAVEDEGELQRKWAEVVQRALRVSPSRGSLLQQARAEHDDGSTLTVRFPAGSTFSMMMLQRADVQNIILPVIVAVFGSRQVSYVSADGGAPAAPHHEEPSPAVPSPAPAAPAAPAAAPATAPTQPTAPTGAADASGHVAPTSAGNSASAVTPSSGSGSSAASATRSAEALRPGSSRGAGATGTSKSVPWEKSGSARSAVGPRQGSAPAAASASRGSATSSPAPASAPEDDYVPYDDAAASAYVADDDLPPFDAPAAPTSASSAAASTAAAPVAPAPASPAAGKGMSSASGTQPKAASPEKAAPALAKGMFSHQTEAPAIPESIEESEELLREVFGDGVKILPADK